MYCNRLPLVTTTGAAVFTLTSSGEIVVITSIYTSVVTPSQSASTRGLNNNATGSNSFFSNTGAVAGVFVVVGLIASAIAIGLGLIYLRRKKRKQMDEDVRIAAGGAGAGGAGVNRFKDEEDDAEDPFSGIHSEGHTSTYLPPSMSSYGAIPLVTAPAAYRRQSHRQSTGGMSNFSNGEYSPSSERGGAYGGMFDPQRGSYGAAAAATSHEGVLYPDWQEWNSTAHATPQRSEGEHTPPEVLFGNGNSGGSAEGANGSAGEHTTMLGHNLAVRDERLGAIERQASFADEHDYSRRGVLRCVQCSLWFEHCVNLDCYSDRVANPTDDD